MKSYDTVTLVCDPSEEHTANALRGMLEAFLLRVKLHVCVWESQLTDFLAGKVPFESQYAVLIGDGHTFDCVKEMPDGSWSAVKYEITPAVARKAGCFRDKHVIFLGCMCGEKEFGEAYLAAGAASYMGVVEHIDEKAAHLFIMTFFYNLLAGEYEPAGQCDEKTAFERAAAIDRIHSGGTHLYRYYSR